VSSLKIGEFAKLFGINRETVRYYTEKLIKEDPTGKIIFDPMTQGGIRSNQVIEALLEKTGDFTYIGMDLHFQQVKNFKKILSMQERCPETVFLAGRYENAPIRAESCDLISCFFGLQTYSLFSDEFPVEKLLRFLKPGGKWFETFCCVKDKQQVADQYAHIKDTVECHYIRGQLSKHMRATFVDSGETTEKGDLSRYFKEKVKVTFFSFVGIKESE